MKANNQDEKEASEIPPRPRRKHWLFRLLVATFVLGVLLVLLAGGLAYYGYEHRVELVNSASGRFDLPFDASIGEIEFLGAGGIELHGLELREKGGERVLLRSEDARWRFDYRALPRGELGSLVLTGAIIDATEADLALLFGGEDKAAVETDPSSPPSPEGIALSWDSLEIIDLRLHYAGDDRWPETGALVQLKGEGFQLESSGRLVAGRQELSITELEVGKSTDPLHLGGASLELTLEEATPESVVLSKVAVSGRETRIDLQDLARRFPANPSVTEEEIPTEIRIESLQFEQERLGVAGIEAGPLSTIETGLHLSSQEITLQGGECAFEELEIELDLLDLGLPGANKVEVEKIRLTGGGSLGAETDLTITRLALEGPVLSLNLPELRGPTTTESPGEESSSFGLRRISLEALQLQSAQIDLVATGEHPMVKADFDLDSSGLGWGTEGLILPETGQRLRLRSLDYRMPGATESIALLNQVDLLLNPREFLESGTITSLSAGKLAIDLRPGALPESESEEQPPPPDTTPVPIFHDPTRWKVAHLAVESGHLLVPDLTGTGGMPFIETAFAIDTPPESELPPGSHELKLTNLRLSIAEGAPPFSKIDELSAQVDYSKIWVGEGISDISLSGAVLEVGEDMDKLMGASDSSPAPGEEKEPEESADDLASRLPDLGDIAIADTKIILKDIAPGLPTVVFGLQKRRGKQRIELARLEIPSPYNTLIPVARLETVFVEFTMAGLLGKRIDRVEIVSPTIFVGEHLFWFVEHYRDEDPEPEAEGGEEEEAGWDIGEIAAHNGKIVIAPKGTPLPGFEVPFPFSCQTKLGQGLIAATLEIQQGDYPIPDLEFLLEGLEGKIEFNLPIKQVSNNLVEVLKAEKLRFKQFEADNAHVSLTYDKNGIYLQFGGEAYEGYINGELNVYIDESYSWDAWVAGTGVETKPLTGILTPEYFTMSGMIDMTLVANGTVDELFQAKGTFNNKTGGAIDVRALEGLEDDIEDPDPITLWLAQAGINVLQNFRYDKADGEFSLYGREGVLDFVLAGPDGRREFDVVIHDHRPTEPDED